MTADPFGAQHRGGVELLTFHSAKGREWPVVVVTGLETGLVPHRSATTSAAAAEEARLLYVAATRSTHRSMLTRAERRGGYARRISPLARRVRVRPDAGRAPARRSAARRRAERIDHERRVAEALIDWRGRAARRASIEPEQLCTVDQLRVDRPRRPRDCRGSGRRHRTWSADRTGPHRRDRRRPRRRRLRTRQQHWSWVSRRSEAEAASSAGEDERLARESKLRTQAARSTTTGA